MLVPFNPLDNKSRKERIIVYGEAGVGKTRFALSLTERFGNILYYAADDNSEFLDSISNHKKKRVFVIKPQGSAITDFEEFCLTDWKSMEGSTLPDGRVFPKIDTIVVDTYSTITQRTLQETADLGLAGAEKHFRAGDPEKGGKVIPNRGDYRGNDAISEGYLDDLFKKQRDYHIVFVCHETLKYIEEVCVGGGPSHPGRRMLHELPARFNTVIRLIRDQVEVFEPEYKADNVVVAITDNDGRWIAKLRTGDDENAPNPLSRVVLDRDPVNFWKMFDQYRTENPLEAEEVING